MVTRWGSSRQFILAESSHTDDSFLGCTSTAFGSQIREHFRDRYFGCRCPICFTMLTCDSMSYDAWCQTAVMKTLPPADGGQSGLILPQSHIHARGSTLSSTLTPMPLTPPAEPGNISDIYSPLTGDGTLWMLFRIKMNSRL